MTGDRAPLLPGGELLIAVGRLGRPHGVKGEIKFRSFFGFGLAELLAGKELYLESEGKTPLLRAVMSAVRPAGQAALASFADIVSPEQASGFANMMVLAPRSLLPDPPGGAYYYEEVVGLPVYDPEGALLGRLTDYFESGAADVWVITSPAGEEIMNPCLPDTLKSVDLKEGRIVMRLMEMESE